MCPLRPSCGTPRVSVVMPVRNAAPFLEASIGSILHQTCTDLELVVLDDASSDGTTEILTSWAARDTRVHVVRTDRPLGLALSSNHVVRASHASIVARMDADDVSHPERLERELAVLDANPDAVLVGTLFEGIDEGGRVVRTRDRWRLLRSSPFSPFPHGSVMFRRGAFEAVGGYDPSTDYWEDLDLFRRLSGVGRVLVLPDALYRYRFHSNGSRRASRRHAVEAASARMFRAVGAAPPAPSIDGSGDPLITAPTLLYSLAAPQLWAGHAPDLLSRLRPRSFAPPTATAIGVLGVAVAAAVSPQLTRFALGRLIALRDRFASGLLDGEPIEWRFAS